MNWIKNSRHKIKAILSKRADDLSKRADDQELKKSNWGRTCGWYIEYKGEIIGELLENQFDDMFWVRYTIHPYSGYEELLFDYQNWLLADFQYLNKQYRQYAKHATFGPSIRQEQNKYTISMRGLYLLTINK